MSAVANSLCVPLVLLSGCLVVGAVNDQPKPDAGCAAGVHDAQAPVLFFSDLEAGPVSGGQNNLGPFITLYGLRLGVQAPGSKVTIGGVEVANYVSWNELDGGGDDRLLARGLERIVVQPGSAVTGGEIVVTVGQRVSNALTYAVHSGHVFLVDETAPPSGDGSFLRPFADIYHARGAVVQAGDIVYVKGGVIASADPFTGSANDNGNFVLGQTNAQSGASGFPIAYIGYPGSPPTIGGAPDFGIAIHDGTLSSYLIANFIFSGNAVSIDILGNGHRLIGNKFTGAGQGIRTTGALDALTIAGNLFFYLGGQAAALSGPITHIDLGWNEFSGCISTAGFATTSLANDGLVVHDNFFSAGAAHSPAFGLALGNENNGFSIYNNVFSDMQSALTLGVSDAPATGRSILHNTIYNGNIDIPGTGAAGRMSFENNVIYTNGAYFQLDQNDRSAITANHNLYFGAASGTFTPDTSAPVIANPLFLSPNSGDFSLAVHSPAVGAGTKVGVCADYLGVARPNPPSLGAVEISLSQ